jgi:hypothetical protein
LKENIEALSRYSSVARDEVSKVWNKVASSAKFAPGSEELKSYTGKYRDNLVGDC